MKRRSGAGSDGAIGDVLDELMNLLSQLGLGPAARPIYELMKDLDNESHSPQWLEQEIRNILSLHGAEACADALISALAEVGFMRPVGEVPAPLRGRLQ